MNQAAHNKLISFIWSIADDCLRDVYVRGKYRDVILPMVVLRRLDTLLEPTKAAVLEEVRFQREEMKATELDDAPLTAASGYVFYNTSKWTLKQLYATATNNQQILLANVEEYLGGFSDNVKEIIARFKLLEQMRHMANKQVLLDVLEKFISPYINLTPHDAEDPDGNMMPGLSNLGMGYVFEELIRKFNEENNEEAGEHFTPREVIHLMTHLIFDPISGQLPPVMTIYDPACGSGGMLTEAQNYIKEPEGPIAAKGDVYLYGKEINDETYAICKSDMMIKGNNPENIKVGSTLATDEFSGHRFDFMLSNPPYGKSWKSDLKHIKDGNDVIDPRFQVELTDYWGRTETVDATPRSSDGQLLFLMEMVGKMKPIANSPIGSRIASVHNGSSLFTGDAGSGESNIRRFIIENDMLDTIIQLPNNLFYNTGITTYIWLLTNAKPEGRRGRVQLIDANLMFRKLRKNLGDKNCEFAPEHIEQILAAYTAFQPVDRELDANGDHFIEHVVTPKKLRGKAKGMIVTQNIEAAIRYYKAVTKLLAERGNPFKALIAFSGEKVVDGVTYTEAEMNGFPEADTRDRFDEDDYRLLVVANKYLTGFDQPKLTTMYVDKKLQYVLAVQALSRLNRSAPKLGKRTEDLFILDFFNDVTDIKAAFDPFYTVTTLSSATDVNVLHELKGSLDQVGVYEWLEVEEFVTRYFAGEDAQSLSPLIDVAADRFNQQLELAEKDKIDFKIKARQFVKIYGQMASIMPFEVLEWEKLFWFLKFLVPKLKIKDPDQDMLDELLEAVDLSSYGLERTKLNHTIGLDASPTELEPQNPNPRGYRDGEPEKDPLDEIIRSFNERWFQGWSATPEEQRVKFINVVNSIRSHPDYTEKYEANTDPYNRGLALEKMLQEVMLKRRKEELELYKLFASDPAFKTAWSQSIEKVLMNNSV